MLKQNNNHLTIKAKQHPQPQLFVVPTPTALIDDCYKIHPMVWDPTKDIEIYLIKKVYETFIKIFFSKIKLQSIEKIIICLLYKWHTPNNIYFFGLNMHSIPVIRGRLKFHPWAY